MELTREDILKLKNKYELLYLTWINEAPFVWKLLTRKEYGKISIIAENDLQKDDLICQHAVVYPKLDWFSEGIPGGWAKTLAPVILQESGFADLEQNPILFEYYRNEIKSDFVQQAEIIINTAFPEFGLESIQKWNAARLWKYLAKAEWKLALINQVHTQSVLNQQGMNVPALNLGISFNKEEAQKEANKKEQAERLRSQGIDPMLALINPKDIKPDRNYIQFPFIYGGKDFINGSQWESSNEEIF